MEQLVAISQGTLIDRRYKVERLLGQGGFGRTYLVSHQGRQGEKWVLKELVPSGSNEYAVEKSRELFQRESKVLYQFDCPQIPKFLECFGEDGRLFLVQEYVQGKSYWQQLCDRKQQNRTFNEAEILSLMRDILPVLSYIHQRDIIHRDISPDNIMLPDGATQPVLIDFGVVKQAVTGVAISAAGSHSANPSVVGKVGYSPLEQIRSGQCFPNSDLYALAVTALVLLSGKTPDELFDSYNSEWKWKASVSISPDLSTIFEKMLAEKPRDRYESAAEVLEALNAADLPEASASSDVVDDEAIDSSVESLVENISDNKTISVETSAIPIPNTEVSESEVPETPAAETEVSEGVTSETETKPISETPTIAQLDHRIIIPNSSQTELSPEKNLSDVASSSSESLSVAESGNRLEISPTQVSQSPGTVETNHPDTRMALPSTQMSQPPVEVPHQPTSTPPVQSESRQSQLGRSPSSNKTKIAIVVAILIAGAFTGSAIVSAILTTTTARQQELEEQFDRAVQAADAAQLLAGSSRSTEELQDAKTRLERAMTSLETMPETGEIGERGAGEASRLPTRTRSH